MNPFYYRTWINNFMRSDHAIHRLRLGKEVDADDIESEWTGEDLAAPTILHWAALTGRSQLCISIVQRYIQNSNIDQCDKGDSVHISRKIIDSRTEIGETPLMWAIYGGNVNCVSQLVRCGARIDLSDSMGYNAYIIATQKRRLDLILLFSLRRESISYRIQDNNGCTPLHWAAYDTWITGLRIMRYMSVKRHLVNSSSYGVSSNSRHLHICLGGSFTDLSHQDNEGNTVIHRSISGNWYMGTRFFLEWAWEICDPKGVENITGLVNKECYTIRDLLLQKGGSDWSHLVNLYVPENCDRNHSARICDKIDITTNGNVENRNRLRGLVFMSADSRCAANSHYGWIPRFRVEFVIVVLLKFIGLIVAKWALLNSGSSMYAIVHLRVISCLLSVSLYLYTKLVVSSPGIIRKRYLGDTAVEDYVDEVIRHSTYSDVVIGGPDTRRKEEVCYTRICYTCWCHKGVSGKHCRVCDICVKDYDHHCFWIMNCVGRKNKGLFWSYVLFISAITFYHITIIWKTAYFAIMNHFTGYWVNGQLKLLTDIRPYDNAALTIQGAEIFVNSFDYLNTSKSVSYAAWTPYIIRNTEDIMQILLKSAFDIYVYVCDILVVSCIFLEIIILVGLLSMIFRRTLYLVRIYGGYREK